MKNDEVYHAHLRASTRYDREYEKENNVSGKPAYSFYVIRRHLIDHLRTYGKVTSMKPSSKNGERPSNDEEEAAVISGNGTSVYYHIDPPQEGQDRNIDIFITTENTRELGELVSLLTRPPILMRRLA